MIEGALVNLAILVLALLWLVVYLYRKLEVYRDGYYRAMDEWKRCNDEWFEISTKNLLAFRAFIEGREAKDD